MSEPEQPAPEQVTVDPNAHAPTAPELDVSAPVPPPEPAPLPPDPNIPSTVAGSPPAAVSLDVSPVEPVPVEPELEVTAPAPPAEPAPLPAEPAPAAPDAVTAEVSPHADILQSLLEELRDLKARIVAAIGA